MWQDDVLPYKWRVERALCYWSNPHPGPLPDRGRG